MTKNTVKTIFIVILFLICINESFSLKCYICSVTEDDAETTCADNPKGISGGTLDCDKKFCTIVRIDYKDPRGKLASLQRSCGDKPIFANEVIEDETHRSYYRSCKTDLCNSGSGRTESEDGGNGNLGDKSTIYCPGIDDNSAATASISISVVLLMLCHYLL